MDVGKEVQMSTDSGARDGTLRKRTVTAFLEGAIVCFVVMLAVTIVLLTVTLYAAHPLVVAIVLSIVVVIQLAHVSVLKRRAAEELNALNEVHALSLSVQDSLRREFGLSRERVSRPSLPPPIFVSFKNSSRQVRAQIIDTMAGGEDILVQRNEVKAALDALISEAPSSRRRTKARRGGLGKFFVNNASDELIWVPVEWREGVKAGEFSVDLSVDESGRMDDFLSLLEKGQLADLPKPKPPRDRVASIRRNPLGKKP